MKMFPHRRMGRFYGGFYHLDDGRVVYIAHRKRTEVFRAKQSWCIDLSTLEDCKAQGIQCIGVVTESKVGKFFYLKLLEDFFGPHSHSHFGDTRQRGLPLVKFRLNPSTIPALIAKAVKLR